MLNKKREQQLVSLLKNIGDVRAGLPQPVFDALCKVVIFPACEMVVMNSKGEFLLTYRSDKIWKGWHFPGRLIRYGQSFEECLKQVAKKELGRNLINAKFLFPMDYNKGLRGPGISLVFLCIVDGIPKDGKFFKAMPKNTIPEHKLFWKQLSKVRA